MDYYFTIFTFGFVLVILSIVNRIKSKLDKIEKMLEDKNDK